MSLKAVILCGGQGTRLGEETLVRPKPLVTVGNHPILWHILKSYSRFQINDFVLALGYKGEDIKNYFLNYSLIQGNFTVDIGRSLVQPLEEPKENWKVSLIDTGVDTLTSGRLLRLRDFLKSESTFFLTYGDGLANIDIESLLKFHRSHGKIATMTVVRPPGQFGNVCFEAGEVSRFVEKPSEDNRWINGGFFVFESKIFDYLGNGSSMLETAPLLALVRDRQLMAYRHEGFWQCMDTQKDKALLNELYKKGNPPWLLNAESNSAGFLKKVAHV
jgi:glucose-1-phosphate cytidylyltransferase